ncbi:MAG: cytochrome C biogenesis protein [Candidatus Portnoybacteria bacterium CG10_big_fil_rev_8_21_14_0_10_36_7]|uniref:Cytochrome C biogenesis protein n=1 Tax=Candidatus Portnoybacteria bacterium CG10_big_fil_rev_8_21_14_0_10_36_7 TaxID=1974812 RepID=A0A2M8KEN5_9BACT|nr:MAG: cytochrome C biogenesis protein [Candidatus Portnoybacteria bacterium CG10_big_fil_rev_8_21_14_0_10_36_7]
MWISTAQKFAKIAMNNQSQQSARVILAIIGIALFVGIGAGLFWLATTSGQSVGVLLTFAAGLSMIFLPCTLPLVFVIVPLTLGKSPAKGFTMALLFGLGISITLAIYGVVVSQLGGYFGLDNFTRYMFLFAGTIAILFGWSELRFIRFSPPEFAGASPSWLQKRGDYAKALGMGVLLGNAGVGCPNPAFYVILTYIAGLGSVGVGAGLGFVHGLGRAVPILAIVILALLGMNATKWVASRKANIDKIMGWSLVVAGAFILTYGLWGMRWWEDSIFHVSWNQFVLNIAPALAETPNHPIAAGAFDGPTWIGWLTWIGVILLSIAWNWLKKKRASATSVIVSLLLVILGLLSFAGVIETKHGHGVETDHAHPPGVEVEHEHTNE